MRINILSTVKKITVSTVFALALLLPQVSNEVRAEIDFKLLADEGNNDSLPTILQNGMIFKEGLLPTTKGYINKKGKVEIPMNKIFTGKESYRNLWGFSEGLALVDNGVNCGYINKKGKKVIPLKYELPRVNYNDDCTYFHEGVAAVMKNDKWGYINKKGKVVIPFKYGWVREFSEGLAKVSDGKGLAYINKKGKVVFRVNCDWGSDFEGGVILIMA